MAHFNFENVVNDLLRLDGPINNGPTPRWQRKSIESRSNISSTSTPLKNSFRLNSSRTPSSKTPKSLNKTPGKGKTPKTPSEDRFIPNRSSMNFEANHFKIVSNDRENEDQDEATSPAKAEFRKSMAHNLGSDLNARIMSYKHNAPTPGEGKKLNTNCFRRLALFLCMPL